jgi:uncharacterized membrane protein YdfJ with MMPL/SSD domain
MNQDDREPVTRVDEALDLLPRDIEPPRDLWSGIEARLEPRSVRAARRWPWLAAAGVLLVIGSSLITANLVRREAPVTAQAPNEQADAAVMRTAFGPGQTLGPGYAAIRQQLADSLAARIDRLPPAARAKLEANLAELNRATAEINAALELNPGDPLLEELLINSYQDELAVLASVNQLTGPFERIPL